jgi:hypothetical protein
MSLLLINHQTEVVMERLFELSSIVVLPFWLMMIVLPSWHWTPRIIRRPVIGVVPAAVYAVLVLPRLREVGPVVSAPNLPDIAALLSTPAGATIAWVHFLAFDLLVGRWMYLDSRTRQISPWLMAPVLFLTLMLGPIGYLLYLAVSSLVARRTAADSKRHDPIAEEERGR